MAVGANVVETVALGAVQRCATFGHVNSVFFHELAVIFRMCHYYDGIGQLALLAGVNDV